MSCHANGNCYKRHDLGETMRKLKTRLPRSSSFRLFLLLTGALLLLAAFAPRANAALIRYYNFEGAPTAPYPVNLDSHIPAVEVGPGFRAFLNTGTNPLLAATGPFPVGNTLLAPGLPQNIAAGDPLPSLVSLGVTRTASANLFFDVPMPSAGIYNVMSVSFAYAANGNGYNAVQLLVSTNGGASFTAVSAVIPLAATPGAVVSIPIPAGTANQPNLVIRLAFTGGQSNGNDLQFQLDNVQINGTIVPEPATVAGGLLGVLGLCWYQRRRLRSLLPRSLRA